MKVKTINTLDKVDNFFEIRSIGKALVVRGFELIVLTIILSFFYFYFPEWNFSIVLIISLLSVVVLSYFLFNKYLTNAEDGKENVIDKSGNQKITGKMLKDEVVSINESLVGQKNMIEITPKELDSSDKLKALEIRLQGIREVTKRARFSFIVLIIASSAIGITVWNGHYSWNRASAFPVDMQKCLDRIDKYTPEDMRQCLGESSGIQNLGERNFPKSEKDAPTRDVISLDEFNRRNLATEWLKSTNISIGLLGVTVNMNDLSVLGSLTLMLIYFWFVFNLRRENRAIVGLLKDVRDLTEFDKLKENNIKTYNTLIASWAYQEIVHSLTFVSIAKDYPLSASHIFPDIENEDKSITENRIDEYDRAFIYRLRKFGLIFLFALPPLVILAILFSDVYSLNMNTAFSENFSKIESSLSIERLDSFISQNLMAILFFIITSFICRVSYIFQLKTTDALHVFAEKLGVDVEPRSS